MRNKVQQGGPLRIAMLGHKRVPSREGGVEIVVEALAVRMAALGHHVTCFNRGGHHVSGKAFDRAVIKNYQGVRIKTVPTIDRKGLSAVTSSFFAALRAAFGRYDIVHFHAEGPSAMLWLPKLMGKRCVVTVHGLDWARDKWKGGFASRYIRFGEREAARRADAIIVLSKSVQEISKRPQPEHRLQPKHMPPGTIRSQAYRSAIRP
jgi:glycosyltransferase involved in cell wall biosynthesis